MFFSFLLAFFSDFGAFSAVFFFFFWVGQVVEEIMYCVNVCDEDEYVVMMVEDLLMM